LIRAAVLALPIYLVAALPGNSVDDLARTLVDRFVGLCMERGLQIKRFEEMAEAEGWQEQGAGAMQIPSSKALFSVKYWGVQSPFPFMLAASSEDAADGRKFCAVIVPYAPTGFIHEALSKRLGAQPRTNEVAGKWREHIWNPNGSTANIVVTLAEDAQGGPGAVLSATTTE
jgi:hypothetical protein